MGRTIHQEVHFVLSLHSWGIVRCHISFEFDCSYEVANLWKIVLLLLKRTEKKTNKKGIIPVKVHNAVPMNVSKTATLIMFILIFRNDGDQRNKEYVSVVIAGFRYRKSKDLFLFIYILKCQADLHVYRNILQEMHTHRFGLCP